MLAGFRARPRSERPGRGPPLHAAARLRNARGERRDDRGHRLLTEIVADAERVDARVEREHRRSSTPTVALTRLHLERVGHHDAVEAELPAQQALDDRLAQRRGRVAERRHADVRRHDRAHAGVDRGAERLEAGLDVAGDDGQLEVRVLLGRAVAGEVLRARGDAGALCVPRTNAATCRATSPGSEPNERTPITGFAGHVHVGDRREVPVHADRSELGRDRSRDGLGQRRRRRRRRAPRCRGTSCPSATSSRVTSPPSSSIASSTSSRSARSARRSDERPSAEGTL